MMVRLYCLFDRFICSVYVHTCVLYEQNKNNLTHMTHTILHAHFKKINIGEPRIREILGQNPSMKEQGNKHLFNKITKI